LPQTVTLKMYRVLYAEPYISSSDNKSVSHWIMFDCFFHVWKVNIFFFLIMFLIYSCSHVILYFLNLFYFLSLVGLWQNLVLYWPLTGLMWCNRTPFGKRVVNKYGSVCYYYRSFFHELMTDFCLFQSHLLSQSDNTTVLL
jgi:hypothetical protein